MSCVHFVVQPLPGSEEQFNDRLRDLSDKINKQGLQGPPITQNISISQVVVSSTHIAFLLQDGSICRVGYSVSSDRLNLNKVENKQSMKESNSFKNERSSRGIRIAESPLILIRGEDVGSMAEQSVGRFASSTGNVSTRNNSSVATTARMSTSGRPRGRIVRAVGRGRGSGVIVGSRPLLPASVVPEDLVNQCQVVLQGKSRSLIVRELQKTNLDVNLAVNNLLSRDDEGDDDGDNCDSYMSDDLMSLLDAGLHSDHPSVIIDSESMFSEDMFGYSTMRARNSSRSRSDRDDRDAIFRLRERTRWLDSVREDNLIKMDRTDGLILPSENKKLFLNPINIGDELVYWRDKDGQLMKFTQIASMYSDLIAVNIQGQLCQWRWSDSDPYVHSENLSCLHSKSASLGLLGEKILLVSACDVRASVFTESGKISTWVDESLGAISTKLDQPAFVCSEFQLDRVVSLHSCWLYTCARLESGALYWWGVMPYGQRKRNIEKLRSKNKKASKQHSTVETRGSAGVDIVIGSQVCLSSSPIYNIGALAFTVSNGVPKVGHLTKAAWDMEEMCRFKIKPASAPTQSQSDRHDAKQDTAARNSSDTFKPDMPPPPSPASSTCSDHSGPSIVSPISLNRKRKQISTWTNEMDRKDEEDWHLKDVVFIEDVKIIPTGKVLKIDGNYVLVRFPSLSQSASKDQSMTGDAPGLLGKDDSVNMLMDTRILRKDELMIVKGTGAPKTPDYFQKIPKRINIGDNSKLLSITVDSQGLHMLASAPTRIMYLYYNMNTCKMEQTCTFTVDPLSFMASSENDPTIYNCDEPNTPLLLRDGNGALYPMLKNCLNGIKDPLWYDMSPLRSLHMSSHFVHNYSTNLKTKIAIIALVNEAQMLMPAILKTDVEKVKNILQNIENKENAQDREKYIDMLLSERCDGNRNIIHACVAMCAPQSNKDNESDMNLPPVQLPPSSLVSVGASMVDCSLHTLNSTEMLSMHHARDAFERHHLASSSRGLRAMVNCSSSSLTSSSLTLPRSSSAAMEQRDGDDMLIPQFSWQSSDHNHHQDLLGNSSVMNMPRVTSSSTNFNLPSYLGQSHQPVRNEEKDRKFNALVILKVLCESPLLQVHLLDLLKAKNAEGLTAFMQCICNRAYTAGLYLLETCRRIAMKEGEVNREVLMSMLFPPQSNLDNSPIHILCCNDMCSFTWTGDEHINQDIFECRTCGLVGSLCCCTECARVCHKGHDCKLKKTSPTAYCDCWEKCKCRSLIAGNQSARLELLNQLLVDTDLVKLPNTRGENILMFLLQTVGRQLVEQRQYRPSRVRSSNHHARKSAASDMDTQMPEHNLEPPKFSRRALERLLDDWAAVKSMLLTGHKEKKNSCSSDVLYEDQMYLESQSGVNQVDKFVHCLIVKCTVEMLDSLLATLIREITNDRIEGRKEEAKLVACKFIRSVVRIFVVLSSEMAPISNKKRQGMGSSPPTAKCKRVFQSLINISIEELCEVAEALISPVRMGVARPTAPFSLVASSNDAIQGSEELFSIETQPMRPAVDGQMPMSSADATETRSANRLSSSERVAQERDHAEEEMADGGPEMEVLEGDDNIDDHDDHHSEHSEHDVNHGDQEDGAIESDMELDMMNASDSDSEESTRSHADNASVQRSAITAATAGSDAGVGSLPYFSDDDEDSGDSSSQDDDSKAGDSADNDADVTGLLDEQIDRRNNNQGSHILQPPQTMQWALRPRDVPPSTTRASLSTAVATTTSGTSGIVYIDPSVLRRTSVNPAITMTVATNQDSTLSMSTTASQLARSFSIVIRQVSDLLMTLHDNQNVTPSLPLNLNITHQDVVDLHVYLECRLKSTWDWLVGIMDATEAQLRFGSVLTGSSSFMHPYKSAYSQRGGLAASSLNHPSVINNRANLLLRDESAALSQQQQQQQQQASLSINRTAMPTKPPTTSATSSFVDGNSARRDYLTYALSLMRAHSREHYNTLPSTDITSLKHVAYVLDALIYYMRSGNDMDNSIKDSMSVQSWLETDDNPDETAFDDYNTRSVLLESESMDNVSDVDDNKAGRKHPFFQRSDSTIFLGCTPPDSFNSPLSESLPLAEQPHLLHPYARKEDLFGMPRQMVNMSTFASDASNCCHHNHQWSFFNQMPTHLALSCRCFNSHSHSSSNVTSFNHSSANATSSSSNMSTTPLISQPHYFQLNAAASYPLPPAPPAHTLHSSNSSIVDVPGYASGVIVNIFQGSGSTNNSANLSAAMDDLQHNQPSSFAIQSGENSSVTSATIHKHKYPTDNNSSLSSQGGMAHSLMDLSVTKQQSGDCNLATAMDSSMSQSPRRSSLQPPPPLQNINHQASVIVHAGTSFSPLVNQPPHHHHQIHSLLYDDNSQQHQQLQAIYDDPRQLLSPKDDDHNVGLDLTNPMKNLACSHFSNSLKNSSTSNASGQSLKSHTVTSANLTDARHLSMPEEAAKADNPAIDDVGANDNVSNTVVVETTQLQSLPTTYRSANLMGCVVSAETLLGRWRLCLDLFGRVFCEDVGSEPGSIISEFGGFTVKEVRFKRDMERFRNSQQRDLSIEVERDRNNLLVQTFKQLNTHFNRRHQNAGPPLAVHRVKVTFRDEPGEGSGVARSFYTAFCHAVLSSDDLPCLDTILSGDLLQRLKSREKERRRLQQHQQKLQKDKKSCDTPLFFTPSTSSAQQSSSNQLNISSQLNNSNDISQSTSDNSDQAGGNDSLSSQKKQLGEKLYPRIYALQPNLASKITGMLMDMGSSYLLNLLASDEQLKQRVSEIMEVIANQSRESAANDSLDGDIFNLTNSYKFCNKKNAASQIKKISVGDEESDVEDNRPLFWQPGKKGYYSPRPGRNTAERLNAYRNVGRIIGLCMLQNEICPLYLNRHVLKFLLGRKISWHDLAFFDPIMYESLRQLILDSESKDGSNMLINMDLTFSVECSADDGGDSYNLVPNGNDIEVNASNIHDYVRKYAHFRMVKMVSRALENMKRGVFDVIPRGSFDGLTSEDLRLLLNGIGDINTQSLINYTSFNDETGDREGSEKVQRFKKWFWSTVEKMNPVERQDLVYFWMSSPALPASEEGFQPMPSVTVRPADDNHLPTANTCISRLYIPLYSSKVILKTKLLLAIKTKSFGFV